MKSILKTLAFITAGLVVGVAIKRVNDKKSLSSVTVGSKGIILEVSYTD
ncbi:hypothetical protein NHG24_07885 [Aerococcaceae bacterium NML210727]|nr:hypothetical protein [Aerococcaceae bacterium NML210727]MCW6655051.1 hypothetical protein [Aerococcaceae bacterium NML201296]